VVRGGGVPGPSEATDRCQLRHRFARHHLLDGWTHRPLTEETTVRKKLVVAAAAGALTLTGLAVAVPAVAATDETDDTSTSVVDRIKDALSGLVDDGSISQEQADEVATTLGDADLGWHGHHGGWFGLDTAAEALVMTEDELRTALEADGATLAKVAEEKGVAVDALVDALVKAKQERIAQAVESGMPQDVADQRLADLEQQVTEWVNSTHEDMPGRGWWGHRDADD
jgi:lambda repressor-like predicted transcriptional regulator